MTGRLALGSGEGATVRASGGDWWRTGRLLLAAGLLALAGCGAGEGTSARGTVGLAGVSSPAPATAATLVPAATAIATAAGTAGLTSATPRALTPSLIATAVAQPGTAVPVTPRAATPTAASAATPTPAPTATPATTPLVSGNLGLLEGRARIGPLVPVERVGVPSPTPAPAVCQARALLVTGGGSAPLRVPLRADCTFRVGLPPGQYVVTLAPSGIDHSKDLPRTITIVAGQAVRLEIDIDTGIR